MNNIALKKFEIINNLTMLPDNKLDELKEYIDFLLHKYNVPAKKPLNLWGAWSHLDLNIDDLENDIKILKKKVELDILQKQYYK